MPHDNLSPNEHTKRKKDQRRRQLLRLRARAHETSWLRSRLGRSRNAMRYQRKALRMFLDATSGEFYDVAIAEARDRAEAAIDEASREIELIERDQARRPNAEPEVVQVAHCPEHGLHGERGDCHVCGGPVQQIRMLPLDVRERRAA